MDKTNSQNVTPPPVYEITLAQVYQYILGPEWGQNKPQAEKPAKKAKKPDAKHHSNKSAN